MEAYDDLGDIEEEKLTKKARHLKKEPERFAELSPNDFLRLRVDEHDAPFHLWDSTGDFKIDRILCAMMQSSDELVCAVYGVDEWDQIQRIDIKQKNVDYFGLHEIREIGDLVEKRLTEEMEDIDLNYDQIDKIKEIVEHETEIQCEMRSYEGHPENPNQVRYICHPKGIKIRIPEGEEELPILSEKIV